MDFFEANKIAGAVLATGLVIFAVGELGDILVEAEVPEENVYVVASAESEGQEAPAETPASPATEGESVIAMVAGADVDAGRKLVKKCTACHSLDKGGPNKIGPNLWDIVGRGKGSTEGFNYSGAITGLGGEWSYEDLDHFLADPKGFAKGTKMSFRGITDAADRADLIAFLRTLSDSPMALPSAN